MRVAKPIHLSFDDDRLLRNLLKRKSNGLQKPLENNAAKLFQWIDCILKAEN